jgi:DNA-binding transcriptional LysR family regulator
MELRQLRHAIAVADEGHFGRAAMRLGMAQPPLSQSIARLERSLGVRIFDRGRSGSRPTEAGRHFLDEARSILAAAERAAHLARAAAAAEASVRIGFASNALWGPLPDLLSLARHAGIAVRLAEMPTEPQLEALVRGHLDLGLVAPPFDAPSRLTVRDLGAERLVAALPAVRGHAMAETTLAALADELILFPEMQGPALHAKILAAFRSAGLSPRIAQEAQRMPTILTLVAAGLGCGLVPEGVPRRLPVPGVVFQPVKDGDGLPLWPLAVAHMPLPAKSPAAVLLAAFLSSRP